MGNSSTQCPLYCIHSYGTLIHKTPCCCDASTLPWPPSSGAAIHAEPPCTDPAPPQPLPQPPTINPTRQQMQGGQDATGPKAQSRGPPPQTSLTPHSATHSRSDHRPQGGQDATELQAQSRGLKARVEEVGASISSVCSA